MGVITFSTLLPAIFGGRQGYVAGAVLLLLALAVLGLLEGAFECILGDDLLLPKHVAAVGSLFVITALNAAAVAVAINAMVQGSKPAAVLSLAVVLALLSTGHALLIRSQRRRHPHQKEMLSWLPSCLASVMLPFVGFWINVGPGIHAAAVAGACVIVSLGAFAPLAVGAPAFKRGRTAGLLQLLHALLALCSVLVTALGGQYAKGAPSLVVWPCCLAGVSTVHYLMAAAVRHPLFNKAESDDGGDGPAASLALLLHVVANVAGAIIVRCYDPKSLCGPGFTRELVRVIRGLRGLLLVALGLFVCEAVHTRGGVLRLLVLDGPGRAPRHGAHRGGGLVGHADAVVAHAGRLRLRFCDGGADGAAAYRG